MSSTITEIKDIDEVEVQPMYIQAKCTEKEHPMIVQAYCRMCEEEKTITLYKQMLALYKAHRINQ